MMLNHVINELPPLIKQRFNILGKHIFDHKNVHTAHKLKVEIFLWLIK
jgi:hypothetical protein